MNITLNQAIKAKAGLEALNGFDRVVQLESGKERVVRQPYKLGEARYAVNKNLAILTREVEAFAKARESLVEELAPEGGVKELNTKPELVKQFKKAVENMLEEEREIPGLLRIKLSKLNVGDEGEGGKNPIPPDVMAALDPLIDDDTATVAAA